MIPEGTQADSAAVLKKLEDNGILGGLPLSDKEILWCATEMNTKEEIDRTAAVITEVLSEKSGKKGGDIA